MMRFRLGGALAIAILLATSGGGGCKTAGVSAVYMTIDGAGAQRRDVFFTDTSSIYCVAKFSSARQDATLDFTIHQTAVYQWCNALSNPVAPDSNPPDIHPIFAVGEQTPGVGDETVVAAQIQPSGVTVQSSCEGYCTQNLPAKNFCHKDGGTGVQQSGVCRTDFTSEGTDSCGLGLTCCQSNDPGYAASTTSGADDIPFPAGEYTCVVSLDGVEVGETSFVIQYPGPGGPDCIESDTNACYCPVPPPVEGVPCYDWVPEGAVCGGDTGSSRCTCEESGIWSCTP
jgi:hypothetical protein